MTSLLPPEVPAPLWLLMLRALSGTHRQTRTAPKSLQRQTTLLCPPGIWAVPPATIFLSSFASMQRSILSHHVSVHTRAVKEMDYNSFSCILQYAKEMSQATKEKPVVTNLLFNIDFVGKLSKQQLILSVINSFGLW